MQKIEWIVYTWNQLVWGKYTVCFLLFSGVWFWFKNRSLLISHPLLILKGSLYAMSGEKGRQTRKDFYTALAGTLGIGSIVGVASAIVLGGPGALIWMLVSGGLGMALKYAETSLACAYQVRSGTGWIGGAMILLGNVRNRVFLSVCFSLCCLFAAFGVGAMAPSAAICTSLQSLFHCERWIGAAVVVSAVLVVLVGKTHRLQQVNAGLLPLVCAAYIGLCIWILVLSRHRLGTLLFAAWNAAFSLQAAGGGIGGHLLSSAMRYGLTRGLFSHEAGMGSAPLAYASHRCEEPAEQGFLGMLEVFFDSFGITLLSGLVFLCAWEKIPVQTVDGTLLMSSVFTLYFGSVGGCLFSIMMILFAFPTILGWYYYADQCLTYLFTGSFPKIVYLFFFLGSLAGGGIFHVSLVWAFSDLFNGCMLIINLFTLWSFQKESIWVGKDYLDRHGLNKCSTKG